MRLTDEQQEIVHCDTGRVLQVQAFAGTGKTSTLVARAQAHPSRRFLYMCYNTSVRAEAERKFPRNVECRTMHSLAWGFGKRFQHKLGDVIPYSLMQSHFGGRRFTLPLAKIVRDTIAAYTHGDAAVIGREHIPESDRISEEFQPGKFTIREILRGAQEVWQRACNPDDSGVPMPHDGYQKLWALSRPQLRYDEILVDEAQDINALIRTVVMQQQSRVLLVGDQWQGVYGFRGAQNAMALIEPDVRLYLTQSWRFGEAIAETANSVLRQLGEQKPLRGAPGIASRVESYMPSEDQTTILCRKNASVILRAIAAAKTGKSLEFIGGLNSYPFDDVLDAFHLWTGDGAAIKGDLLRPYASFQDLADSAQTLRDPVLSRLVEFVETEQYEVPELVRLVTEATVPRAGDVVLSTTHKAKGLEWDRVVIEEDFPEFFNEERELEERFLEEDGKQELNLLYVAATRARQVLYPSASLRVFRDVAEAEAWRPIQRGSAGPAGPAPATPPHQLDPERSTTSYPPPPAGPSGSGSRWARMQLVHERQEQEARSPAAPQPSEPPQASRRIIFFDDATTPTRR